MGEFDLIPSKKCLQYQMLQLALLVWIAFHFRSSSATIHATATSDEISFLHQGSPPSKPEHLRAPTTERKVSEESSSQLSAIRYQQCRFEPRDPVTGDPRSAIDFEILFDVCTSTQMNPNNNNNGAAQNSISCMRRSSSVANYLRSTTQMVQFKYKRDCPICREQCQGCQCSWDEAGTSIQTCDCGEAFPGDVCCRSGCCASNNCNCGNQVLNNNNKYNNAYLENSQNYNNNGGSYNTENSYNGNIGGNDSFHSIEEIETDSFLDILSQSCPFCLQECYDVLGDENSAIDHDGIVDPSNLDNFKEKNDFVEKLPSCQRIPGLGSDEEVFVGPYCSQGEQHVKRAVYLDSNCTVLHPLNIDEDIMQVPSMDWLPTPELAAAVESALNEYAVLLEKSQHPLSCDGEESTVCQEINAFANVCVPIEQTAPDGSRGDIIFECSDAPLSDSEDSEILTPKDEASTNSSTEAPQEQYLDDEEVDLTSASLSFEGCSIVMDAQFVVFSLCKKDSCDTCEHRYVDMQQYLTSTILHHTRKRDEYCSRCDQSCPSAEKERVESVARNAPLGEDEKSLSSVTKCARPEYWNTPLNCAKCRSECMAIENMVENGYLEAETFSGCQIVFADDLGKTLYAGPICSSQGSTIQIGVFADPLCQKLTDEDVNNFLRYENDNIPLRLSYTLFQRTYDKDTTISCVDSTEGEGFQICRKLRDSSVLCDERLVDADGTSLCDVKDDTIGIDAAGDVEEGQVSSSSGKIIQPLMVMAAALPLTMLQLC